MKLAIAMKRNYISKLYVAIICTIFEIFFLLNHMGDGSMVQSLLIIWYKN